jgi:acyl carrier protein
MSGPAPHDRVDPSVLDRVRKILADQTAHPMERILADTKLSELRLDSLDNVEVVMDLEDVFDIDISDSEAEACRTVADLEALVRRKGGGA